MKGSPAPTSPTDISILQSLLVQAVHMPVWVILGHTPPAMTVPHGPQHGEFLGDPASVVRIYINNE